MQNNLDQKQWATQKQLKANFRDIQAEQTTSSSSKSWVEQVSGNSYEEFKRPEVHVYLAGPDVFYPDAIQIGDNNKKLLVQLGMIGHFPFDNIIDPEIFKNPKLAAQTIAENNEKIMKDICSEGRVGVILANMNPWHGPSTDVGTSFEIGFMSALSHFKNVIIIGYSEDTRKFEDRVTQDHYKGNVTTDEKGRVWGSDGKEVEKFGCADNLMLTSAIERTGGKICKTFEEAAILAKELSDNLIKQLEEKREQTVARQNKQWAMS